MNNYRYYIGIDTGVKEEKKYIKGEKVCQIAQVFCSPKPTKLKC